MAGPNENDPVRYLAVTYRGRETFTSKFHGDTYEWSHGEILNLTEAAARHIFGYGLTDKSSAFQRNGWLNSRKDGTMKHAVEKLAKFHFEPVQQIFEIARARQAGGSERPLADAGDNAGEEQSSPAIPAAG